MSQATCLIVQGYSFAIAVPTTNNVAKCGLFILKGINTDKIACLEQKKAPAVDECFSVFFRKITFSGFPCVCHSGS